MRLHNSKNIPNWIVASAMSEMDIRIREVCNKFKGSPKAEVIEEMRKSEPQATPEDLNRIYDEENGVGQDITKVKSQPGKEYNDATDKVVGEVKPVEPPKEVKDKMEGGSAAIEGDASLKQANSPNIDKVVDAIKSKGTEAEFVSPNFVNDIANRVGVELTSDEVVYISDNIENLLMGIEGSLKVADQTITVKKTITWQDKQKRTHTKETTKVKVVPDNAKVKDEPIPEGAKEKVEEEVVEAKKEEVSPKPIESESVSPQPAVGVEAAKNSFKVGDKVKTLVDAEDHIYGGKIPKGSVGIVKKNDVAYVTLPKDVPDRGQSFILVEFNLLGKRGLAGYDAKELEKVSKDASKVAEESHEGLNGYVAMYKGKKTEVWAKTSYEAQKKAAEFFKAKKSYEVTVMLAEKAEEPGKSVVHDPSELSGAKKEVKVATITHKFEGGNIEQLPNKNIKINITDKSILEGINDLPELFEAAHLIGNGWSFLSSNDVGGMTAAPIVGYDVDMDDQGTITSAPNVWWYPQYETKDPIEELRANGSIILTWAEDAKPTDPESELSTEPNLPSPEKQDSSDTKPINELPGPKGSISKK